MNILLSLACVLVTVTLHITYVYLRRRNSFLRKLQGPESSSFWLGRNEKELRYQNEVGDNEYDWIRRYGTAWRSSRPLGVDYLSLADPKALQYVLHTSGYHFAKDMESKQSAELALGRGIIWTHGTAHQRQRRIMTRAFLAPQLRAFLPLFQNTALRVRGSSDLTQKWKDDVISLNTTGQAVVDVTGWLSRTTLDIIAETGFDSQFGSLNDEKTLMAKLHENLLFDSTLYPSHFDIIFKSLWRYIPEPLLHYVRYLPSREYRRLREYSDSVRHFSRDIIKDILSKGDGQDIMSALLRANASENPDNKMSDEEVNDQIASLLFAGHETTASSMSWFLWEVAKHPDSQDRIRAEIAALRARKEGGQLSATDLDSMAYTMASLKESMRLHPILSFLRREAERDDVIPLAFPITTKSGEQILSIPVKKGTCIEVHIGAYNRLPEVWGPDADEWNPDRFLDPERGKQISVGVFANLLNFSGGLRGCLGWRFAVLELQVLITTLLENFEFSVPQARIYRKPGSLMIPMTEDREGACLELNIKALN
ncbi:cytochrome P450 [Lactifluus volemus]|nr:cytochrome P450 [Lactifluus volemus]